MYCIFFFQLSIHKFLWTWIFFTASIRRFAWMGVLGINLSVIPHSNMVFFSTPVNVDRFNATVYELLRLRFHGPAYIPGRWDPCVTLDYLEERLRLAIIPTFRSDGSLFFICDKYVLFCDQYVVISQSLSDL